MALDGGIGRNGRSVWRLGQAIVVVLGAFLVATAIGPPLTRASVSLGLVAPGSPEETVLATVFQFIGFVAAVVGYLYITEDWSLIGVGRVDRRGVGLIAAGTVLLLALQFLVIAVFSLAGITTGENQAMLPGREDPTYFLYMVIISVIVVGPAEELLFRGVVQGLLRRAMNAVPAIAIASGLFGIVHVTAVVGTTEEAVLYAVIAGLLGCVLGYLYEHTENVAIPGITHGLYNASLFAIQFGYYTL